MMEICARWLFSRQRARFPNLQSIWCRYTSFWQSTHCSMHVKGCVSVPFSFKIDMVRFAYVSRSRLTVKIGETNPINQKRIFLQTRGQNGIFSIPAQKERPAEHPSFQSSWQIEPGVLKWLWRICSRKIEIGWNLNWKLIAGLGDAECTHKKSTLLCSDPKWLPCFKNNKSWITILNESYKLSNVDRGFIGDMFLKKTLKKCPSTTDAIWVTFINF